MGLQSQTQLSKLTRSLSQREIRIQVDEVPNANSSRIWPTHLQGTRNPPSMRSPVQKPAAFYTIRLEDGQVTAQGLTCCCSVASVMSDSLWPHGLQPTSLLQPCDSPRENAGVACHALLQGRTDLLPCNLIDLAHLGIYVLCFKFTVSVAMCLENINKLRRENWKL